MSDSHDTAQVCLNGHSINSSFYDYPDFNKDYCSNCGAKTITKCPNCDVEIQGFYRDSMVIASFEPPKFCHKCGNGYPWTVNAIQTANDLITEFDDISEDEITILKDSIGDLIKAGPKAIIAEKRYNKTMAKVDSKSRDAMKEILTNVLNERVKKSLFGE